MWIGGVVPLGYDIVDRKLVINPAEAETVRHILRRTMPALLADLRASGIVTKQQRLRDGSTRGGCRLRAGRSTTC